MAWQAFVAILAVWVIAVALTMRAIGRSTPQNALQLGRYIVAHLTAERRANTLMRSLLSPRQLHQLRRRGFVEVDSPSIPKRVYRVPGTGGLVRVYEGGHAIMDLCLQPVDTLPEGDLVVMHKLMIEGNEQEYLAKANHFAPGIISLRMSFL